jgi:deoxyribonuclease-4
LCAAAHTLSASSGHWEKHEQPIVETEGERMMRLGCHVSIRGGYLAAAKRATAIGAQSYQYFPKNPRSLAVKTFDERDAALCRAYCREHGLVSIAHSPYPVNIAAADERLRKAVVASLRNDLAICEACGSVGLVVHFGKYRGKTPLQAYQNSLQCINEVLDGWRGEAKLLIENLAGEGTDIGMTLEESVQIRKLSASPDKIGFCLDTCHLFASGVWDGGNWAEVRDRARQIGYFDHLLALHLNDSMYPAHSRRDRHEQAGRGRIGAAALRDVLLTPELANVPVVLETPVGTDGTHAAEMAYVRGLAAR